MGVLCEEWIRTENGRAQVTTELFGVDVCISMGKKETIERVRTPVRSVGRWQHDKFLYFVFLIEILYNLIFCDIFLLLVNRRA